MLTADELSAMRATANEALPDTCVITRGTATSNSGGGATVSWVTAGTVDCRLAPLRGLEQETGERISEDAEFILTVPSDTTIGTDYRAAVNGEDYDVVALQDRSWALTRRLEVKRR